VVSDLELLTELPGSLELRQDFIGTSSIAPGIDPVTLVLHGSFKDTVAGENPLLGHVYGWSGRSHLRKSYAFISLSKPNVETDNGPRRAVYWKRQPLFPILGHLGFPAA
jgi:hypothetical protein